jgi:hypothetical protein
MVVDVDTDKVMAKLEALTSKMEELSKKLAEIPGLPGVTTDEKASDDDGDEDEEDEECDKMEAKAETKSETKSVTDISGVEFRAMLGITERPQSKELTDFQALCRQVEDTARAKH